MAVELVCLLLTTVCMAPWLRRLGHVRAISLQSHEEAFGPDAAGMVFYVDMMVEIEGKLLPDLYCNVLVSCLVCEG